MRIGRLTKAGWSLVVVCALAVLATPCARSAPPDPFNPPDRDPLETQAIPPSAPAYSDHAVAPLRTPRWPVGMGHSEARLAGVPAGNRGVDCEQIDLLPVGLLYPSYLAGEKEPRFALQTLHQTDRGWIWEVALGGRAGIARIDLPEQPAVSWQLDIEGAALTRLDLMHAQDMDATDYRFGVPITWRSGPLAAKVGYYHLSSHTGDEYLEKHPHLSRVNYVRESVILGVSRDLTEELRVYGEVGYAFFTNGGAEPFELQFGAEYSARQISGPFAAVNGHLREEFDFGGSVNCVAGWQFRGMENGHLLRIGVQYYNGKAMQYTFFDDYEELLGVGLWFDY